METAPNITNIKTLKEEFSIRANLAGLTIECPMDGVFNAEVAIVAEAPGEHETAQRLPLVGSSGQLMFKKLRDRVGLSRMQTYITNVCKRQVSFGESKRHPINRHEQDQWNDLLLWELSQLPNLKYVVAAGNFALAALTGQSGITSWRGSVLDVTLSNGRTVKVLCTYNPAMVLREPKTEITFNFDIAKLKKVMDGKHKVPVIKTIINPAYITAMNYLDRIHKDAIENGTHIAYDIEVISGETACIGFANSATEAICINFRMLKEQLYSVEGERELRKKIAALLGDTRVRLVAQNGMFDMTWLWYKDAIRVHSHWLDTMLAHHTLYPQLPHNLGFICTQYTDHPYYKDEKDDWREGGDIDRFWRYNGTDCCVTWEAARRMARELERENLAKFFFGHVMRLQPLLARMTVGGIKMDMTLKEKIKEELSEEVAKKLAAFHEAVAAALGDEEFRPNPRSPRDLASLFFGQLKLVGRGTSTDAANRQRMYNHPRTSEEAKRVITLLNDYLKDAKFLSTYAEMRVDPDGRARSEYKQTGVQSAPGRLSSSAVMWGSGMNFQNQPSRAYPMFVADPGCGLGYFDMAQAEARIVAYEANILKWKEDFERARIDGSYDAHRALAADMFKIPYDEVPTYDSDPVTHEKTLRFIAKRCRHGLNYRMAADRLAETTGLSNKDATTAYYAYHRSTPELRKWWDALEKEVRATRTLFNAYGRRLIILERLTPEALESIVAFKPQSTLGDHVTMTMYMCEEDARWPSDARMWLNNHDALIVLAPEAKVKSCLAIMKEHAERPILIKGEQLIIPADTKISKPDEQGIHRWSTLEKVKL